MNDNNDNPTSASPVVAGNLKIGAGLVLILIAFLFVNPTGTGWDNAWPAMMQLAGIVLLIQGLLVRFRNRKGDENPKGNGED
jgi:hypothetical protein